MGWNEVNIKDLPVGREQVALGEYTFQLLPGAELDEYGAIQVQAAIASDGDNKGRRVFFSYPDPTGVSKAGKSMKWSAQAFKQLEQALGVDATDAESPLEYLNRAAGSLFAAVVGARTYIKDGEQKTKHELSVFTVKPAV